MSHSSTSPVAAGSGGFSSRLKKTDPILILCLLISFFSGITALNWGRYDCLNPDATAFKSIKKWPPLHPERFDTPPLHTYLNNTLINEPSKWVTGACVFFGADKINAEKSRWQARVIAARILQAVLMLGCVVCVYLFARDHVGLASARVSALLLATSASFLLTKIFLTADTSLVFWMLASLVASGQILKTGGMNASLLAGIFAGFATATKYNGLAIALAIPLAHMLYRDPRGALAFFKRRAFWVGGFAVPISFVIANPYCILNYKKFGSDFMYNYSVTPIYDGQTAKSGYGDFVASFPEIFGWPLCLLLPVLIVCGLAWTLRQKAWHALAAMALCAAVFALYFWKIGGFPRIETRFVLPTAPLLLLLAAPGWQLLARWKVAVVIPAALLALYGLASGHEITRLFAEDPRAYAIEWADQNFPDKCRIDASTGSPQWKLMPGKKTVVNFPVGLDRNRRFSEALKDNPWVKDRLNKNMAQNRPEFFTPEELAARNPDFITVDSQNLRDKVAAPFLNELIAGKHGYEVAFEKEAPPLPSWVYPSEPNCLRMKFFILRKKAAN